MNKIISCETIIKIPFYDMDSMGVAWHGNYAKYLEVARCDLMDKIDYNYNQMQESGYAWPVVTLEIKYIRSFVFGQEIKVTSTLCEYENYIKIKYVITDLKTGEKLTKAETKQIAIDMKTRETCYISPDVFLNKISKIC